MVLKPEDNVSMAGAQIRLELGQFPENGIVEQYYLIFIYLCPFLLSIYLYPKSCPLQKTRGYLNFYF